MATDKSTPNLGLDLEDFVREALVSIFKAVKDAGTEIASNQNHRGAVVPAWDGEFYEQEISFDVAVTVGLSKDDQIKPKIQVLGFAEVGGTASNKTDAGRVSRVSFSVPVALPATVVSKETLAKSS